MALLLIEIPKALVDAMIKESVRNSTRRLASSPKSVFHAMNMQRNASHSNENNTTSSMVTDINDISMVEDDSEIEILGPYPVNKSNLAHSPTKLVKDGKLGKLSRSTKPIHPIFLIKGNSNPASKTEQLVTTTNKSTDNHNTSTLKQYSSSTKQKNVPNSPQPDPTKEREEGPVNPQGEGIKKPTYSYLDYDPKLTVAYIQQEEDANEFLENLTPGPVALDTEWRVFFTKTSGKTASTFNERRTAVVQIADQSGKVAVIQVYGMSRFPKNLQALIENPNIPKVGVNILNDGRKLFRDYGILAKNLVELGSLSLLSDPTHSSTAQKQKIISLAKLVDRYCHKTLLKGPVRTGNWEARLSKEQIHYAANDAHSSLMVYLSLLHLAQQNQVDVSNQAQYYTSCVEGPKVHSTSKNRNEHHEPVRKNPMRSQHIRAYQFWHIHGMSIVEMCHKLSLKDKGYGQPGTDDSNQLKPGTVVSYIIGALQADPGLPYDFDKLLELVQMDAPSFSRHREWLLQEWLVKKDCDSR